MSFMTPAPFIVSSKTSWELWRERGSRSHKRASCNGDFIKAWSRGAQDRDRCQAGEDIIGFYPGIELLTIRERGAPASYLLILAPLFISRLFPILGPRATANVFKNRRIRKKIYFTAICWLGWVEYFERCINHKAAQYLTNLCLMFAAAGAFQTLFWLQKCKIQIYLETEDSAQPCPGNNVTRYYNCGCQFVFTEGGNGDIRDITGMEIMIMRT